jgi:hypothetical protein
LSKGIGQNLDAAGNSSRAGCEANMHKQEAIRMSQSVALDRCYPEAMELAGFIVIPTGSRNCYSITPPEETAEERVQKCNDIPAEYEDQRAACETGSEGTGGAMKMRIGKVDDQLQIDLFEGGALVNEATYGASGDTYTASVVRIGDWGGKAESSSFDMTVDLGAAGSVANGIPTLGTDGYASAEGHFDGGFGDGVISFRRNGDDSSNVVSGAFEGSFTDPSSDKATSFTGKAYSKSGGSTATGCAKFSFTGSMPPMEVADMVPFDISQANLENFLQSFGSELGIDINSGNYSTMLLCPNPDFDLENPDPLIKPMVQMVGDTCESVTHTGVECFGITNGTLAGDFGTEVTQSFTIIANTGSPFYDEVNAFDLATLDPAFDTIAFSRNWDGSGTCSEIDFSAFSQAQMQTAMTALEGCFALEEKARGNEGMGGYNCGEQEQENGVNDFVENGGSDFGNYGGELTRLAGGTCPDTFPDKFFINSVDVSLGAYCLPIEEGVCAGITVAGTPPVVILNQAITVSGSLTLTALTYNQPNAAQPATSVEFAFAHPITGNCNTTFAIGQPSFDAPGEFGGEGEGNAPGEEGFLPAPCIEAGFTEADDEDACRQLCNQPGQNCSA